MKNKYLYVIIAILVISIFSCQRELKLEKSKLEFKDSLYYKNASLYTGWIVEYYPNGNLKSEDYYKEGLQNGISRYYYDNNQLMQEIKPIGNGKGLILMYHKNGQMSQRILLRSNILDENDFEMWDENGEKVETSFQEWLLFLQSQGIDFGYIPSDLDKVRPKIKDSLLNKN